MPTSDLDRERATIASRLANERNVLRPPRSTPVCLAYPSAYRAGMSSLGFQTLYRILNEDGPGAHRAFLPDEWEPQSLAWPQPRRPILAYESGRRLSSYGVIGVSCAYELEVTGVVRLLEGAGIPVLAADRGPRDPVLIFGGPLTFSNPSCLLPFADLLIMGEAEEELPVAIDRVLQSTSREAGLAAAATLDHTMVGEIEPGAWGALPETAVAPAGRLPARSAITTPDTELRDMFLVEPERGCSRQCTFCVMRNTTNGGMRILDVDRTLALIPDDAPRVGLVGAAVTDHPDLQRLVEGIVDGGRGIGISSLRADRLTPALLDALRRGGYRTITVASDGISQRMRDRLMRRIDEDDLRRAAQLIRAAEFHRMKVYEMIGAPGETDDDVDELIETALELASMVRLTLTISTFVAKRNTPLDGQPFIGMKAAESRLQKIRAGVRGKVELRPQSPRWAHVEYELARRGAEAGHAAIAAVHAGGSYRDWCAALAELPPPSRPLRIGGDEAMARRQLAHADRRGARLSIIA